MAQRAASIRRRRTIPSASIATARARSCQTKSERARRSRGQDREAEGRSHALGLKARARRRSRHRNRRRGGTASRDEGDITTTEGMLTVVERNLAQVGTAPTRGSLARPLEEPRRRRVKDAHRRTKQPGFSRWHATTKLVCRSMQTAPVLGLGRQASDAAAGRNHRAVVRPQSRAFFRNESA